MTYFSDKNSGPARCLLCRIGGVVVCVLAMASSALALTSYQTSQLEGTWFMQRISVGGVPRWERSTRGNMGINAYGYASGNWEDSNGNSGFASFQLDVLKNGFVVRKDSDQRMFLSPSKDLLVGVEKGSAGEQWLTVLLKQRPTGAPGFRVGDLAGSWQSFGLETGGSSPGWLHATLDINSNGVFTYEGTASDGDSDSVSGVIHITNSGEISIQGDSSIKGQLNLSRNMMVHTAGEGSDPVMQIFIKEPTSSCTQDDLTGSWLSYALFTGEWQGYEEESITIDGSGSFSFFLRDSDGNTENGTLGPVTMNPSGSLSFDGSTLRSLISPDKSVMAMVQSDAGEHSLSLMVKRDQTNYRAIRGRVTYNGNPECTMVLVNGQYAFTCDGTGAYELVVPLNPQGQVMVQAFCRNLAPYRQAITPAAEVTIHDVAMTKEDKPEMSVTIDTQMIDDGRARVRGAVTHNANPLNAMVLINGQYTFTPQSTGAYDLGVPLNPQGQVTVQVFCANMAPFRQVVTPE